MGVVHQQHAHPQEACDLLVDARITKDKERPPLAGKAGVGLAIQNRSKLLKGCLNHRLFLICCPKKDSSMKRPVFGYITTHYDDQDEI